MNFKKIRFVFCVIFFFCSSFVLAMEKEQKMTVTPSVQEKSILGMLNLLEKNIVESSKIGPEEKQKSLKNLQSKNDVLIKKELKQLMFTYNQNLDAELLSIGQLAFNLYKTYDQLPKQQFQQKAMEYFSKIFGCQKVFFLDKLGGEQLGNRVIVEYSNGQKIIYHAKTHRGGLKSQHSSSIYPVDLKELIAYKILEHSGTGTETHFFYDNIKNFYIATKDAGYSDIEKVQKEFLTYDKIREKTPIETLIKDPKITNGFIKTDILSRLLLLSDVLNNGGNTGLSSDGTFKVIDFNPPITKEYQNPKIFEDWLSGNNQYNYSDKTVISILKKGPLAKIKESSQAIIELQNFEKFVTKAYDDIIIITKSLDVPSEQIADLENYVKCIIYNYTTLMSNIKKMSVI